ncbi:hypothetical protein [Legionella genomosp. 1]|uniref:hypothetical protein n=1 Tax=Legionella genomosp. 1 TaxID=1093625 RepID=UPI001055739F|nr:hypothetical protein [Legionella genomosp. 1]
MSKQDNMTVQEAGSEGGKARAEKYSEEELSEQAKRASQTVEEREPGFHSKIGEKGGKARGDRNED